MFSFLWSIIKQFEVQILRTPIRMNFKIQWYQISMCVVIKVLSTSSFFIVLIFTSLISFFTTCFRCDNEDLSIIHHWISTHRKMMKKKIYEKRDLKEMIFNRTLIPSLLWNRFSNREFFFLLLPFVYFNQTHKCNLI